MVHAHAHHKHGDVPQKRSPDDGVTVVYVTAPADFDGPVGGYVTGEKPAATKANVGVGAPVGATRAATKDDDDDKPTKTAEPETKKTADVETKKTAEVETQKTAEPNTQKTVKEEPKTTEEKTQPTATRNTKPQTTQVQETQTQQQPTRVSATQQERTTAVQTTLSTSTSSKSSLSGTSLENAAATNSSSLDKSTASPSAVAASSGGISDGAKAGIAIGVILGVGLIAGLIFFFLRKKKQGERLDDAGSENEKAFVSNDVVPPGPPPKIEPVAPSNPPQLNVRPVTQFAPDLTPSNSIAAFSVGGVEDTLTPAAAAAAPRNLTGNTSPHTPTSSSGSNTNPFNDPVNPFAGQAEASSPVNAAPSVSPSTASAVTPAVSEAASPADGAPPSAIGAAGIAPVAAVGAVAGAAASSSSEGAGKDLPDRPGTAASQTPSDLSQTATSPDGAIAAVPAFGPGGPAPAPSNVHRVQMDFNPSMEDELELHAGQLVRLLHEYDDGWALCVRLDRSQQGVAPRSCLSSRPVKPRARPPPGAGPGPRGPPMMAPNGPVPGPQPTRFYPQEGRSMSPVSSRPMSPAQRPMSPAHPGYAGPPQPRPHAQRPMSPAQFPPVPRSYSPGPGPRPMPPRSMSPGPYGPPGMQRPDMPAAQRQRSNSAGGPIPRTTASPGPSPLAAPMPPPTGALPALPTAAPTPVEKPGPDHEAQP